MKTFWIACCLCCVTFGTCSSGFSQENEPVVIYVDDLSQLKIAGMPVVEPEPMNIDSVKMAIGYPPKAVARNIQGQVIVQVLVDEDGQYVSHEIVREGHRILAKAVSKKIHLLRFSKPVFTEGEPAKVYVNIPFNFRLLR